MKKLRLVLTLVAIVALGGPIAWALLGDASLARDRDLLDALQRAEDAVAFRGVRTISVARPNGMHTTVLKVAGRAGERSVEFVEERLPGGKVQRPAGASRRGPDPFEWIGRMKASFQGGWSDKILRNYTLARLGSEALDTRVTERYELRPRHAARASYRMWVDRATRLLRRVQVVAIDGSIACDIAHETLEFNPVFGAEDFRAAPKRPPHPFQVQRRALSRDEMRGLGFQAWLPERLPAGFELTGTELLRVQGMFEAVLATYSDGLATIAIVEFRADNPIWLGMKSAIPGFSNPVESTGTPVARRLSHAGGTLMNVTLEGTEVFVAGQIAGDELESTVRSLRKAN